MGRRSKKNPVLDLIAGLLSVAWLLAKLIFKIVAGIVSLLAGKKGKRKKKISEPKKPKNQRIVEANEDWINERWALAAQEEEGEKSGLFPKWYFDEMTEFQALKLFELGIQPTDEWTKGQTSDVIGLFSVADLEDEEVLRFFGVDLKGMNQSKARHLVAALLVDSENKKKWDLRPPSNMQKALCKLFGLKIPKGINHKDLAALMSQFYDQLDDERQQEWDCFESTYEELNDPDNWPEPDEYSPKFRRTSFSRYVKAVAELKEQGSDMSDLDTDLLIEHLYENFA